MLLRKDGVGIKSAIVTEALVGFWCNSDVTNVDEIYDIAFKNTYEKLFISDFENIRDMMISMAKTEGEREMFSAMPELPLYVVTNKCRFKGSMFLLDEKLLKQIHSRFGEDFYILPSSVHEFLVSPKSMFIDEYFARKTIMGINAGSSVHEDEKLSDDLYICKEREIEVGIGNFEKEYHVERVKFSDAKEYVLSMYSQDELREEFEKTMSAE